jgi:hypothetical protein
MTPHTNIIPVTRIDSNHPTIKIQTGNSLNEIRNSPVQPQINFNYKGPISIK